MTRRARKLPLVLIVFITVGVFLPVLQNGFVDWDAATLVNNSSYRGLGWPELRWMFAAFHFGQYQPVTWTTLGLDHLLWWSDPFGYHWSSLLMHVTNAILFYLVTLRLFSMAGLGVTASSEAALRTAAGLAALVFAIHPLRVEPVAWASARGELLGGMFFLVSILCYLQAIAVTEHKDQWFWCIVVSVFAYGFSLLSSADGIALPIILLVLDVYPLGRLRGAGNWLGPEARRLCWQKTPYLMLTLVAGVIAFFAAHQSDVVSANYRYSVIVRIIYVFVAPAFYLWKTVMPFGLSPLYELPGWSLALGIVAFLVISVCIFLMRRRVPVLLAIWISYVALLLPDLGSDYTGLQLLADRQSYLSCLPWAVCTGAAMLLFWNKNVTGRHLRWPEFVAAGLTVSILIGIGVLASAQTRVWRDSETLWKSAAIGGSSQAYYNLAALFETRGKYDESIASYEQVVKSDPLRWDAHEKAALLLQKQGKIREAVEHYRQVIQLKPDATEARNNLASGLVTLGELREATQHFRKILEYAPERNDARVKLGTILTLQGFLSDAADLFQQAIDRDSKDAKTLLKLGQVLAAQGALDRAIQYFRDAAQIQPEDAEIQESLARALLEQGKRDEAAQHLQEAVRILKSSPVSR